MWHSLGKVTVAVSGNLQRATVNEADPAANVRAHGLMFQAWPTNTGRIWIFDRQTGSRATGVGVVAILAVPTANILPSASATITSAPNALIANNHWIDAEVGGDGCIVSYLRL